MNVEIIVSPLKVNVFGHPHVTSHEQLVSKANRLPRMFEHLARRCRPEVRRPVIAREGNKVKITRLLVSDKRPGHNQSSYAHISSGYGAPKSDVGHPPWVEAGFRDPDDSVGVVGGGVDMVLAGFGRPYGTGASMVGFSQGSAALHPGLTSVVPSGNSQRQGFEISKQGFEISRQGFGISKQGFGISKQGFGISKQGFGISEQGLGIRQKQILRLPPRKGRDQGSATSMGTPAWGPVRSG